MKKLFLLVLTLMISSVAFAGDWQTQKCYRGFADIGSVIGAGNCGRDELTISTTHGYQFIPSYLFVGAGVGCYAHTGFLPIYADFRAQLPAVKWSPFLDAKIGYSGEIGSNSKFTDGGFLFNPSVGVTWNVSKKIGLELMVGYTTQNAVEWSVGDPTTGQLDYVIRKNRGGINVTLGVTF